MSDGSIGGPVLTPAFGQPAAGAVVLLHGLGSDGDYLMHTARPLVRRFPRLMFAAPHGPEAIGGGDLGRRWCQPESGADGLAGAAALVDRHVRGLKRDHALETQVVALVGFSQGGAVALSIALQDPCPVGAVAVLSGARLSTRDAPRRRSSPGVLFVHGLEDRLVPVEHARRTFRALAATGLDVDLCELAGLGHAIDRRVLSVVGDFLNDRLCTAARQREV